MEDKLIEEAAERYVNIQYPMGVELPYPINDFISGAEWAIKRMYGEEEVRLMLSESFKASQEGYNITTTEIIEQFKKNKI